MAKKGNGFGKLVAFATVAGAVAAGISYFTKYKSFHKELEEDFHDFEDDGNDDISKIDSTMNRNYVSLHADKDEFKVAASDMADAARDAVVAAKNLVKDAAGIMTDTAREAVSAVSDTKEAFDDDEDEDDAVKTSNPEADADDDGGLEYTARGMEFSSGDTEFAASDTEFATGDTKFAAGNSDHTSDSTEHTADDQKHGMAMEEEPEKTANQPETPPNASGSAADAAKGETTTIIEEDVE